MAKKLDNLPETFIEKFFQNHDFLLLTELLNEKNRYRISKCARTPFCLESFKLKKNIKYIHGVRECESIAVVEY